MTSPEALGNATVRRVEWLTLVLGGLGAAWAAWHWGWRGAVGLALGAGISWLNFRWLKGSVRAFGAVATAQAGVETVRVPVSAYLKFFGRFALLLGVVYVILTRTWFPAVAVLAGLFASAAAVVVGLVYELLISGVSQGTGGNS
jgi:hypothetical protein